MLKEFFYSRKLGKLGGPYSKINFKELEILMH